MHTSQFLAYTSLCWDKRATSFEDILASGMSKPQSGTADRSMLCSQVGLSLRPRHWENLKYSLVKAADSRTFDIFHAMIKCSAFDFIEKGRRAGEDLLILSHDSMPFFCLFYSTADCHFRPIHPSAHDRLISQIRCSTAY